MPIYAYRCATCGHAQDVLQKISDPLLTVCTACGAATFEKQITAAGFQLKGSGWYVTDFRNGNSGAPAKKEGDASAAAEGGDKPATDKPAADKPVSGDKPVAEKSAADKPAASSGSSGTPAAPAAPAKAPPPPAAGG